MPAGWPLAVAGALGVVPPGVVAEAEEDLGGEEELSDRARGTGIDLGCEHVEIGFDGGAIRMFFGIG